MTREVEVLGAELSRKEALAIERDAKRHLDQFTAGGFALAVDLRRLQDGGAHLLRGFPSFGEYIEAKFGGHISASNAKRLSQTGRIILALEDGNRVSLKPGSHTAAQKVVGTTGARALAAVQGKHGTDAMLAVFDTAAQIAKERGSVITDQIVAAVLQPQLPPESEPEPPAEPLDADDPAPEYELSEPEQQLLDIAGAVEDDCLRLAHLIESVGAGSPKVAAYIASIVEEAAKLPEAHGLCERLD